MNRLKASMVVGAAVLAAIAVTKFDDKSERDCVPVRLRCDAPLEFIGDMPRGESGNYGSFEAVVGKCGERRAYSAKNAGQIAMATAAATCVELPCKDAECVNWHDGLPIVEAKPLCVTSVKTGSCICVRKGVKSMGLPDQLQPLEVGSPCLEEQSKGDCVPRPCAELAGYPWSAQ